VRTNYTIYENKHWHYAQTRHTSASACDCDCCSSGRRSTCWVGPSRNRSSSSADRARPRRRGRRSAGTDQGTTCISLYRGTACVAAAARQLHPETFRYRTTPTLKRIRSRCRPLAGNTNNLHWNMAATRLDWDKHSSHQFRFFSPLFVYVVIIS